MHIEKCSNTQIKREKRHCLLCEFIVILSLRFFLLRLIVCEIKCVRVSVLEVYIEYRQTIFFTATKDIYKTFLEWFDLKVIDILIEEKTSGI